MTGRQAELPEDSLTVEPQRFAMVPEWLLDAEISDCAVRLYAVLLRYGGGSGRRMPSRSTLARRLHKRSVDTVDRAMKELAALGAVVVERRRDGRQHLTNRYHVRTSDPGRTSAATSTSTTTMHRTPAASPGRSRAATGSPTDAAQVAADLRPDPEALTESTSTETLLEAARRVRRAQGLDVRRWTSAAVARAVTLAAERGHPETACAAALLAVAADAVTISPMRLAEAGPWWTDAVSDLVEDDGEPLDALERELDDLDGARVRLQRDAREQLRREGVALTRRTVLRRAVAIKRQEAAPADLGAGLQAG